GRGRHASHRRAAGAAAAVPGILRGCGTAAGGMLRRAGAARARDRRRRDDEPDFCRHADARRAAGRRREGGPVHAPRQSLGPDARHAVHTLRACAGAADRSRPAAARYPGAAGGRPDRSDAGQRSAARAESQLQRLISETPFMLTRCSRDLRYVFVSRAYADMVDREPAEIEGRPVAEIMGDEGFATIRPFIEAVLAGNRVEYESDVT